jgi:hypothetical protein
MGSVSIGRLWKSGKHSTVDLYSDKHDFLLLITLIEEDIWSELEVYSDNDSHLSKISLATSLLEDSIPQVVSSDAMFSVTYIVSVIRDTSLER